MLVPPESSSAVLVMMCSESVSVCNHSRARLVDSSRNRTFSRGYHHLIVPLGEEIPLDMWTPQWKDSPRAGAPRSRGISSPSGTNITSLETRDSSLSYGEDPECLSHPGLVILYQPHSPLSSHTRNWRLIHINYCCLSSIIVTVVTLFSILSVLEVDVHSWLKHYCDAGFPNFY